jgi:cytosine/adenosine deaminase-related metal-dependent hydrolase
MGFRKIKGDKLFTGTELLTGDKVLITDEKGVVIDIVALPEAGEDIQHLSGLVTPGFVNCHCHLELSHMRGLIPEKTGLVDFVFSIVTQRHFPEEEILAAIETAEKEMLQNGIVAAGDICNNGLTLLPKLHNNLAYYNFVEVSGWLPAVAETRFSRSKALYDAYLVSNPTTIVPHAPYSVSLELWHLIQPFYQGAVVSIHNQETVFEDNLFLKNEGAFVNMYQKMGIDHSHFKPAEKTSLQSYFSQLEKASNVLLVHNTFTNKEDIIYAEAKAKINDQGLFWCLCVNANRYIENTVPHIHLLRKHTSNIVLGTDSLASNWSLSIWDEITTLRKYFPNIPLEEMLKWATLNGAKALKMDDRLGSFEKGKTPGVILIDDHENNVRRII